MTSIVFQRTKNIPVGGNKRDCLRQGISLGIRTGPLEENGQELHVDNDILCVGKEGALSFCLYFSFFRLCTTVPTYSYLTTSRAFNSLKTGRAWGWGLVRKRNLILSLTEGRMRRETQVAGPPGHPDGLTVPRWQFRSGCRWNRACY